MEIKSGLSEGDVVYVEAKAETTSAVSGLLSGLFGSQQMNPPMGGGMGGGNMPDPSQMGGGGYSGYRGDRQMGGDRQ